MNNLEWLKKLDSNRTDQFDALCIICYKTQKDYMDCDRICDKCSFNSIDKCVKYLQQEHKELIKLTQFEYDLIEEYRDYECDDKEDFDTCTLLVLMKSRGYFKGVINTSITLKVILENCEIVSDDYFKE